MAIPDVFNGNLSDIDYQQGVIIAEVASMLLIFIILKVIHYVKWGFDDEQIEK